MINYALRGIVFMNDAVSPSPMSSMSPMPTDVPMHQMADMKPMAEVLNLLPLWVTCLWLVALAAVLVFHCGHFVRMGGERRWFHASHILMLVSMLYMFASMEFKWKWFPSSWWVVIFWLSTAAVAGWMILRFVQRRPFSFLWIFALIMQAAMIYMWMPAPDWVAPLTWTVVVYYGLETVAWLGGLLDDSKRMTAVGPGDRAVVVPVAPESAAANLATQQGGVAVKLLEEVKRKMTVLPMNEDSAMSRVSMAVMAASMGYMFAAMQLMRSAMM